MNQENINIKYSIIIPVLDEEHSVMPLYHTLAEVMDDIGKTYEIIFVDDGSTDSTLDRLKILKRSASNLKVISLKEHAGQSVALQTGFEHGRGDIFITLDGDGQDDPEQIPRLLYELDKGYDVIYGWRYPRQDSVVKRTVSKAAYFMRKLITKDKIHDFGSNLRAFRKRVMNDICLWSGLHRFFSVIMVRKGFKVGEVKVRHRSRKNGVSKYGTLDRLIQGTTDLFRICFINTDILMKHQNKTIIKEIF